MDPSYQEYRDSSCSDDEGASTGKSEDDGDDVCSLEEEQGEVKDEIDEESLVNSNESPCSKGQYQNHVQRCIDPENTLKGIANQACQMLGHRLDLVDGSREQAEHDPSGELRCILGQISDDSHSRSETSATTRDTVSSKSSIESAPASHKKRGWDFPDGHANEPSEGKVDFDEDAPYPSPKRRRTSQDSPESDNSPRARRLEGSIGSSKVIRPTEKAIEPPASTASRGVKRSRESSNEDIVSNGPDSECTQPKSKRVRLECSDDSDQYIYTSTSNSNIEGSTSETHNTNPKGFVRQFRPTFYKNATKLSKNTKKIEFFPDTNVTDDWVVTGMRDIEPGDYAATFGSQPRIEPKPRSWEPEEAETLRSWVQDYGVKKWNWIAWCLRRS